MEHNDETNAVLCEIRDLLRTSTADERTYRDEMRAQMKLSMERQAEAVRNQRVAMLAGVVVLLAGIAVITWLLRGLACSPGPGPGT